MLDSFEVAVTVITLSYDASKLHSFHNNYCNNTISQTVNDMCI